MSLRFRLVNRLPAQSAERLAIVYRCLQELRETYRRGPSVANQREIQVDDVRRELVSMGIGRGDVVHLHSGASRLLAGSSSIRLAGEVVRTLIDLVGDGGTILMNTDSVKDGWDHAARRDVFDYSTWPSRRGLISEVFRRRPDVVRSVHPWYNVTAWGRLARDLVEGHEQSTPYTMDANSPWARLNTIGGKVVLLGTGYRFNSLVHLVEYLHPREFPRAVFLDRPVDMYYMTRGRRVNALPVMLHARVWKNGAEEKFGEYLQRKYGFYRTATLRNGAAIVSYHARDQYEAILMEMKAGVTWYDPQFWH